MVITCMCGERPRRREWQAWEEEKLACPGPFTQTPFCLCRRVGGNSDRVVCVHMQVIDADKGLTLSCFFSFSSIGVNQT